MEILLLAVGLISLGAFTTYIIASEIPQKILEHMQRNGRYTGLGEQSPGIEPPRRTQARTPSSTRGARAHSDRATRTGRRQYQKQRPDAQAGPHSEPHSIPEVTLMQQRNPKR